MRVCVSIFELHLFADHVCILLLTGYCYAFAAKKKKKKTKIKKGLRVKLFWDTKGFELTK